MTDEQIRQLEATALNGSRKATSFVAVRDFGKATEPCYLATFAGLKQVAYIRGLEHGDPWVVSGTGLNAQSFCVCSNTMLYRASFLKECGL